MLKCFRQAVRLITGDNIGTVYSAVFIPGMYKTEAVADTAERIRSITVPLPALVIIFNVSVAGFMEAVNL